MQVCKRSSVVSPGRQAVREAEEQGCSPHAAALTIVLGEKAPGEGEPEQHTSYAKLVGDRLYLWGDDKNCPGTLFAVYGFLENILGVVWPMLGDANIVVPKADVVRIPAGWSWKYRPPLKSGMMRGGKPPKGKFSDANAHLAPKALRRTEAQIAQANKDVRYWKLRQKMWIREEMPFGHAFTTWNNKYLETHPEYLALQKNGERGTSKKDSRDAKYMKLCVSNEDVVDVIVENYVKAGKPKYYNICPNDGYSFCRCEKCRALDCPQTDDERELKFSQAVNLTDRYVNFWNRIAKKIVAIRPDVMLDTYAYSCYRDPPRVRAMAVLPRHAILTRDFQLAFDSERTGNMAPDFAEKGLKLLDFRIKEVQSAITPINWGPTFRAYPFEVKYWRQKPIKKELRKLYPEMGYEG